ncbi:MAG: cupredoxin domain-containing protein [Rhodospirillales bacterium]
MTSETGPSPSPEHRPPGRVMKLVVVAAALLVVAGGIAFYVASQTARRGAPEQAEALTVTITGRTCEPNVLTVPAGRNTFRIVNKSDRAVEWEILDGVMVVEERENIAPGFTQTLTAKLAPGHYAITCGLLSNPRGTLHVTPSAGSEAETAGGPPPVAFIGPLAEYQVYLMLQSAELAEATGHFAVAIKSGDLAEAKALYAPARLPYKRMEPVAERFRSRRRHRRPRRLLRAARAGSGIHRLPPAGVGPLCAGQHRRPRADRRQAAGGHHDLASAGARPRPAAGGAGRRGSAGPHPGCRAEGGRRRRPLRPHRPFRLPGKSRRQPQDRRAAAPTGRLPSQPW